MKAVQIDGYGGPEALQYREVPEPRAAAGEVVINVRAVSVNPGDVKVRKGLRPVFLEEDGFPHTLGRDFSGVVAELGAGVTDFKPGDEVFGVLALNKEGSYAERVAVPAELIARKPTGFSHVETVSVALTGLTALYSVEDSARIKKGETILIHGGSGGIGTFSVQYCKSVGATVYTTASARNHEYVKRLGADCAIDYHSEDFEKRVPPCDVVFDMVGGETQRRSLNVLKSGGRMVIIAPSTKDAEGVRQDITLHRPIVSRDRRHLERISELLQRGAVKPPPLTVMKLSGVRAAHELMESGRLQGKIVFDLGGA